MRLETVHISGFRGLADLTLPLGDLTVLVGPNGSGKSSVADALLLLHGAMTETVVAEVGERGGMGSLLWNGGATEVQLALGFDGGSYDVVIAGTTSDDPFDELGARSERLTQSRPKEKTLFVREEDRLLVPEVGPAKGARLPRAQLFLPRAFPLIVQSLVRDVSGFLLGVAYFPGVNVSQSGALRRPYNASARTAADTTLRPDGGNLAGVVSVLKTDLRYQEQMEQVDEWLHLAFSDFNGLGIQQSSAGSELNLQWREHGRGPLHPGQLSDGVLRFLALAVLCASPQPPSLTILDEPEVGLHPALLPLVGAMLKTLSRRAQVMVLTHSPVLLDAFPLEALVVMAKDDAGCHAYRAADSAMLRALLEPTLGDTMADLFMRGDLEVAADTGRQPGGPD